MNEPHRPVLQFRRTTPACTGQSPPIPYLDLCRDAHHGRFCSYRLLRQRPLRSSVDPIEINSVRRRLVALSQLVVSTASPATSSATRMTTKAAAATGFLRTCFINLEHAPFNI